MTSSIKIKVNGLTHGVTASLDTPLLYVLHNELHLHGPRFGCGLAQCGACSVLLDGKEIRSCVTPVAAVSGKNITTLEGLPALWAAQRGTTAAAPALASVAAGMDRRSGAALRLLPERDDDPGRRPARDDEEPVRGPDPHGDERAPLPLRHVSENPDRDPEGRGSHGKGRCVMTGLDPREGILTQDVPERRWRPDRWVVDAERWRRGQAQAPQGMPPNVSPDATQVDTWLAINGDGSVTMYPPKMDFGQGTWTGFKQIVAEELDVSVDRVLIPIWDSGSAHPFTNNPASTTVGSNGTANGGPPLRQAAAQARQALLGLASAQLGVPVANLSVSDGVVSGGGKSVGYGQLLGGKLFSTTISGMDGTAAAIANVPVAPLKAVSDYKVVGTRVPRFDIPAIVTGTTTYIQNVRVPGMLHGRPVRPRGQANLFATSAQGGPASATVVSIDASSIAHIPGAQIVQKGNFVGVVAPKEYDAVQAAAELKVEWVNDDTLAR